jgi:hypothetical protein
MLELLEIQEVSSYETVNQVNDETKAAPRVKIDLREIEILERRIVPTGSGETFLPL